MLKIEVLVPGVYVDEGPDRDKLTAALARENYIPVYMDHRTVDLHYNGFCNSVLWQLFHYVPLNMDSKLSETRSVPLVHLFCPQPSSPPPVISYLSLQLYVQATMISCHDKMQ